MTEPTHVPLSEAAHIIDAINAALDLGEGPRKGVEFLLKQFREMLGREEATCSLILYEGLQREPGPGVIDRFRLLSPLRRNAVDTLDDLQRISDELVALHQVILPKALAQLRTPMTVICSQDMERQWFDQSLLQPYLQPIECVDLMIAAWAASEDRMLNLTMMRHRSHASFEASDRNLFSLMLRAMGPLVDRELFRAFDELASRDLTDRQREVLRLLLRGDSEKEIAHQLGRSIHTIHSHVKEIYRIFAVQSRGELMALFVDKRLIELCNR